MTQKAESQSQSYGNANANSWGSSAGSSSSNTQNQLQSGYQVNNQNRGLFNNQAITPFGSSSANNTSSNGNKGVIIQFQLRGYSNPSSALPNSQTCTCPSGYTCAFLKTPPRCYFAFTFIVSSPEAFDIPSPTSSIWIQMDNFHSLLKDNGVKTM
ncbi:hypothetical protein CAEBREN_30325 [Caenorhabditis brenneri]|uniref:Uncharacterized protein n=1 Tax=Caenorhabditis brenneri TaxID=135651 RepID=G0PML0_CAEBE|nr:hypothetical protein CAEBREN_30325 [Caenorhabditis brenneri]